MPPVDTITQTETVADTQAGWSQTLNFGQFDPTLGSLQDVRLTLVGDVTASASIENLGPAATSVEVSLPTVVSVAGDGIGTSVNVDPTTGLNLGAYDGTTDYAGSSGTVMPLAGSQSIQSVFTLAAADAHAFIGAGSVSLTAESGATSSETGDANLRTLLQTDAGAVVSVAYDYSPGGSGSSGAGSTGGSVFTSVSETYAPLADIPGTTSVTQTYSVPDSPSG